MAFLTLFSTHTLLYRNIQRTYAHAITERGVDDRVNNLIFTDKETGFNAAKQPKGPNEPSKPPCDALRSRDPDKR